MLHTECLCHSCDISALAMEHEEQMLTLVIMEHVGEDVKWRGGVHGKMTDRGNLDKRVLRLILTGEAMKNKGG